MDRLCRKEWNRCGQKNGARDLCRSFNYIYILGDFHNIFCYCKKFSELFKRKKGKMCK